MRDAKWATANCTLQFSTVGIWPDGADGTDVNCSGRANQAALLATGDDFGMVNLYHYPTMHPKVRLGLQRRCRSVTRFDL